MAIGVAIVNCICARSMQRGVRKVESDGTNSDPRCWDSMCRILSVISDVTDRPRSCRGASQPCARQRTSEHTIVSARRPPKIREGNWSVRGMGCNWLLWGKGVCVGSILCRIGCEPFHCTCAFGSHAKPGDLGCKSSIYVTAVAHDIAVRRGRYLAVCYRSP
jgi:hypothetical protein